MAAVKDHEDPHVSPSVMVTVVGLVILVVCIYGLHAIYYKMESSEENVKLHQRNYLGPLEQSTQEQAKLASWRYIDFDRQLVAIPIEEAMRLEVTRLQAAKEK